VEETFKAALNSWDNFYVIVGSSGAALTGLQFVVMTLITESRARRDSLEIDAFGTPTVVHFCAVLLVAAILSAPWGTAGAVANALLVCGLAGMLYTVIVTHRARFTRYRPVFEDWLFHVVLPFGAYLAVAGAAVTFRQSSASALFVIAAATLMLLFAGIHNAWDTVTFIATGQLDNGATGGESKDRAGS
jgi:hypothetical protein